MQDSFEMNAIIPSFLKFGDTIAIVATARWISPEQLQPAITLFESWGFRVKLGKYLHTVNFQLAGTDAERTADLQWAMDDPEIKAVVIARGGYGTVRIIDQIDFSQFVRNPKWICGYSDITVLHAALSSMDIASIHSTMPISFPDATPLALENLRMALTGELLHVSFTNESAHMIPLNAPCKGRIFGGNLSVLFSLLGSKSLSMKEPFILFLEDVDEMIYHIDRMVMGLERAGVLTHAVGICVGGFTQMKDNTSNFGFPHDNPWGSSPENILKECARKNHLPICFGMPAGHQNDNRAFYLGVETIMQMEDEECLLKFQHS